MAKEGSRSSMLYNWITVLEAGAVEMGTGSMHEVEEAPASALSKRARVERSVSEDDAGAKKWKPAQEISGVGQSASPLGAPLVRNPQEVETRLHAPPTLSNGIPEYALPRDANLVPTLRANQDSELPEVFDSMSDQTLVWTSKEAEVRELALRVRVRLYLVLSLRPFGSIGVLRASVAAERLRPVVNHFCDASFGLWTSEQDLERVVRMLSAVHQDLLYIYMVSQSTVQGRVGSQTCGSCSSPPRPSSCRGGKILSCYSHSCVS